MSRSYGKIRLQGENTLNLELAYTSYVLVAEETKATFATLYQVTQTKHRNRRQASRDSNTIKKKRARAGTADSDVGGLTDASSSSIRGIPLHGVGKKSRRVSLEGST